MEPFRVHILGCGSALPTLKHFPTTQIVEVRGKFFMVDCGEGAQVQLRRSRVRFTRINAIFISHLHGDHCFGLIGMISTFGLLGRTAPLHIYAHEDMKPILQQQIDFFCNGMDYDVVVHAIDTAKADVIYDDKSVTVTTIPLCHRKPCCGFLFQEKQTAPHIRRDVIDAYGIPLSQIGNIKKGADWVTDDGDVIPNERLVRPAATARSYAYCGDTRYMPELYKMIKGVDLLYHESTYTNDEKDKAVMYNHSTAEEAAMVARDAGVKRLLLGHFSSRYDDESVFLKEAKAVFDNVVLSDEMKVFDV